MRLLLLIAMVMTPMTGSGAGVPLDSIRPHLDVRLEDGWRYDQKRGEFRTDSGESCETGDFLPKDAEIRPTVEALAKSDPGKLSPDELDLAHFVQIVFPGKKDPSEFIPDIEALPCVRTVKQGPKIGLP